MKSYKIEVVTIVYEDRSFIQYIIGYNLPVIIFSSRISLLLLVKEAADIRHLFGLKDDE